MPFDWHAFHARNATTPTVVDPRRRMMICFASFLAALVVVFGRAAQFETSQGEAFREAALRPVEKTVTLPAVRGRILACDGSILAQDETVRAVAVEYRRLEEPANARWLRTAARARLPKADRKSPRKVADEQMKVLAERAELARRLAALCGRSSEQWTAQTRRIQRRVEAIAADANQRRTEAADSDEDDDSWSSWIRRLLLDEPPPPRITVADELAHQIVAADVPPAVVAEIEGHPERYPATKIVEVRRRAYPEGTLAAHVVGYSGGDDPAGRAGVERQYEAVLKARPGAAVEQTDRRGRILASSRTKEPEAGRNIVLSLHPALQRTADELLHSALERLPPSDGPHGGAVVVMDVRDGAIRAAASAPRFDPNVFSRGNDEELAALLDDSAHPLFDRVGQMALPPGSTFKTLSAVALLESGKVDPRERFACRGFLNTPDRRRCEVFIRQGVGHSEVTLADALAVSCNVYFFHHAERMGPKPLLEWAERFGFGRPTGIDLPGEAAGSLPNDGDALSLAIGQGTLTATPLQVVRMMAAVANGGKLVTPHVVEQIGASESPAFRVESLPIAPATLAAVREGLRRVVADSQGTAHGTVYLESIAIVGKTGTAETGDNTAAHAWFAGYAPADDPKLAFVVVLERAGDAAAAAGPVAKRLVLRMDQLGML